MMTVLVLICAATVVPADCNRESAGTVMVAPPAATVWQCATNGLSFAAQLARAVPMTGVYPKMVCEVRE